MTADSLAQKERQLDLVLALDRARDSVELTEDPNSMFEAIVDLIKSYFDADVCAIMLMDDKALYIESIVYRGMEEDDAIQMCKQAMKLHKPGSISSTSWNYNLGVHIIHDHKGQSLGGLFLGRTSSLFNEADVTLLQVAETQIDSAIIQAHKMWELAQQNLQLEAIYQIDRLRDDNPDESDLINSFTGMLVDYFKAELCMVFLSHIDDGEMILRGMVDKENVPYSAMSAIERLTDHITMPQVIESPEELKSMTLLAAPLIVSGLQLGSVVIGRKRAFTSGDHRLIYAMISQMDSAIVHSRVVKQLLQRNHELETIYRIDKIRDSEVEFEEMMHKVLNELCNAAASEMGYLMLYKEDGEEQLQLQAATADIPFTSPMYFENIKKISRQALEKGAPVFTNRPNGPIRSVIAIPLILNEKIIGVFGVVNSDSPRGFSQEDRRMLTAITSQVDTAVFERLERRRMRKVLSRSVDPKVIDHLLNQADENVLTGERVVLSTLFADLRGSTAWAEKTDPEELVSTLNEFLGKMVEIIFKHGGTLDKFVGDEVIALFGSPVALEDHAKTAAVCALEMQAEHKKLQEKIKAEGRHLPAMGIGISSGEVIAGEFGPPIRTDFTAMGRVMNLGARLCGQAGADQIYISKATHTMIETIAKVRPLDPVELRGIGQVHVCELLSLDA